MIPEQFKKLPKWAQVEFDDLQYKHCKLEAQLQAFRTTTNKTQGHTGIIKQQGLLIEDPLILHDHATITFNLDEHLFNHTAINLSHNALHPGALYVEGLAPLVILPRASNHFLIKVAE